MKIKILYIILGVLLLSVKGVGQNFTLSTNSYSVSSTPINYNCSSVSFDCINNTLNSLIFYVYSSSTGQAGTYNLIFSNTVSANNTSQLTFYNVGTIYYYAEVNTSPTYTSSIYQVEVRSKPSSPIISSNTPICAGSNLLFSATNVAGGTFSWSGVNGFSSSLQNPIISSATTVASGNYTATVTVNGCTSSSSAAISTNVYAIPNAPTITSNAPICAGDNLTFNTSNVAGGTFSWSGVNGFSSSLQNPTISSATTAASGNYTASVTVNGCTSPSSTVISAIVNSLPVINSLSDTTKVCGTKTILDAGAGYSSYSWNNGATSRFISTDVSQNYFVTVTNSSSCSSIDSTFLSIIDPRLFNSDTTILSGATVNLGARGILNSANRTVLYNFSNVNALNDFSTLTTNSGTITITSYGQTGNGVELVRANNCCSDAEMKTIREDFGYGTYEVDAYSASGVADQSFGVMEQSGSWLNRVLNIGTRPSGTDNPGWDVYFKGIKIAGSNTSPVNNNTWYKIKVYITPTSLKIWLNNTSIYDGTLPSSISNPRGAIRVGAYDISRYDNITYTPYQELSYLWSNSSTSQNIAVSPNSTTTYQLKVSDQTTTCNTSIDIRLLKIDIINNDASICNNTTQTLYIDSTFSKYKSWQTKKSGIEFYNIKKDLNGNLYALPSLNNQKIYKSIDRGETWNQMTGFPSFGDNNFMALGVDQNNVIYASTNNNGIYKSVDEGVTWVQVQDFGGGCGPMDILFGSNYSILTVKGSNRGIWSSNGNLINWQQKVINFDPNSVTKDIYDNIYSGGNGYDGKVLYKSSDAGATWSKISSLYGVQLIRADSTGKIFLTEGGTNPLYVSNNQGGSFSLINSLSFPNSGVSYPEDILFTKNIMFITKGQVYYSKDNGVKFTQLDKLTFPTAGNFNYGPGGAPNGNYGDSSNRMEIIGNRLFVASIDGIKFIDIDNLNTTVTWSTGEVGNHIIVNPIATSPGYTSTYSATVTYGSSSGSDQVTFSMPTKPTISSSGATSFCQGGNITLTANSIPSGTYTYTWQTGQNSASINVTNAGSYSVTATNSIGCVETSTPTIVTINSLPSVSAASVESSGTTNNDGIICAGASIKLTGSGASTYVWNNGITNNTNFTPANTMAYTVTGTDANGCVNTGSYTVTVNSLPSAPIVTDKDYCFNETASPLTATNLANHNLGWYGTDASGGSSAATAPIPLTNIVGSFTYYVSQTNSTNGCESPRAAININIKALPPTPTISSNSPVCEGAVLTLKTSNISGAIYYWEGVNGFTSSSVNPSIYNVSSANAGNYSLKIKFNGCESPVASPVIVVVNPTPAAPIISSNSPIEEDKTLNLTASNVVGVTYAWSGPNGFTSNQQNPSITSVSLANSGTYYASVSLNGCTSINSLPIIVVVNAKVLSSPVFQMPNAFTPNNDGHNDSFKIIENGYVKSIISFKIFTKTGKLIFSDKDGAWDGRYAGVMLDSDVYYWVADIINKNNLQEHFQGPVLLLK